MPSIRLMLSSLAGAAGLLAAVPAVADDTRPIYHPPAADAATPRIAWAPGQEEAYYRARGAWLNECRRRMAMAYHRDDGVGGAVIGGLLGGLAGNRIAGRNNRTFGTIAGAAVGGVAGAMIDKAEDRGRSEEPSDYCESYLDYYSYVGTYQQGGYGNGQPVMLLIQATPVRYATVRATPSPAPEPVYEEVEVPVEP